MSERSGRTPSVPTRRCTGCFSPVDVSAAKGNQAWRSPCSAMLTTIWAGERTMRRPGLLEHLDLPPARPRPDPVVEVDRGGKITWHGPGQLVGYPIVKLPGHVFVVDYVRRRERAAQRRTLVVDLARRQLIRVCSDLGLTTGRVTHGDAAVCPSTPRRGCRRQRPARTQDRRAGRSRLTAERKSPRCDHARVRAELRL